MKKGVVQLLSDKKITYEDFKTRYIDYYTAQHNLTVKKSTEKFNNDLRALREGSTLTYGRVSTIILIVLKMTLVSHTLVLVDMEGNEEEVTINVQGF